MAEDKLTTEKEKNYFKELTCRSFAEQAQHFLNALWDEHKDDAETLWKFYNSCKELDKQFYNALPESKKGEGYKEGTKLDEFWSHKLFESYGKPMTIQEFRQEFKKIDIDFDKLMSLLELLIYWFKASSKKIANFYPGQAAEVIRAQELLREVEAAFKAAQDALEQASKTEAEAQRAKTEADKRAQEAKKTAEESEAKAKVSAAAEAELKAALNDLKSQEDAYAKKTEELKAKAEGSGVAAMRAKNELAQHLGEDPLPLRKAKITTEAATKKAEKAAAASAEAFAAAEKARKDAEQAKANADAAAVEAEADLQKAHAAVEESQQKVQAAEQYLEEQKAKGGGETHGTFWWMDRELAERKKYMPKVGHAKLTF